MSMTIPTVTSGGCSCGSNEVCDDPVGLERTRYFTGQLVGPEDLTQDQRYFREKHRRHNRMLHGWGVVCGVSVQPAGDTQGEPIPYTVCVGAGYVLGPYGDEILVDGAVPYDVRRATDDMQGECPPPVDPWCAEVRVDRDPGKTLYLAIRYDECPTRPVSAESGCGCDAPCEYSRTVDGYALGILDELPDAYRGARDRNEDRDIHGSSSSFPAGAFADAVGCTPLLRRTGRSCPPCPTSPWVILADLRVRPDGTVDVDPWAHRRFIAAFGSHGFFCDRTGPRKVVIDRTTRETLVSLLTEQDRPEAETIDTPDAIRALPATKLRGADISDTLKSVIGTRTVGELARTDADRFVTAALQAGIEEEAARTLIERARLLDRIVTADR